MATHCSTLAWRIPTDRAAWLATARGVTKSQTWLNSQLSMHAQANPLRIVKQENGTKELSSEASTELLTLKLSCEILTPILFFCVLFSWFFSLEYNCFTRQLYFCYTTKWTSHRYTYMPPSWASLHPPLPCFSGLLFLAIKNILTDRPYTKAH